MSIEATGLEYRLTDPSTIFAQPRSLARPAYLRHADRDHPVQPGGPDAGRRPSGRAPSARWRSSSPIGRSRTRSARGSSSRSARRSGRPIRRRSSSSRPTTYARFMDNHGLLRVRGAPAVANGHRRVAALRRGCSRRPRRAPAARASRSSPSVAARRRRRASARAPTRLHYDRVILATHTDQALALLEDPDAPPSARSSARSATGATRRCCTRDERAAAARAPRLGELERARPGRPGARAHPHRTG